MVVVSLSTSGGAVDLSGTVTVTATIEQGASQVTSVEFYVDSELVQTGSGLTYSWNTESVFNGPHELKVKATYGKYQIAEDKLEVTVSNSSNDPSSLPPDPSIQDPPSLMDT